VSTVASDCGRFHLLIAVSINRL